MIGCINFFRWVISGFLGILFVFLIIFAIVGSAISTIVTNPATPKAWIKATGVYDHVLEVGLIAINAQSGQEIDYVADVEKRLTENGSELKTLADKILSPAAVEANVNIAIDATYRWLDGQTAQPQFSIALVKDRATMVDLIAAAYKELMRTMPMCDATFVPDDNYNPLAADCQPVNYDLSKINTYVANHGDDPMLKDLFDRAVISSDLIRIDQQTSTDLQVTFKVLQLFPLIMAVIVLIWALMLWIMIPGKRAGVVIVGFILSAVAGLMEILSIIAMQNYEQAIALVNFRVTSTSQLLIPYVFRGIHAVYADMTARTALISFAYLGAGILFLIIGLIMRKRSQADMIVVERPVFNS